MSLPVITLVTLLTVFLFPVSILGQVADAPTYNDGDWWRIKLEVHRPTGVSVSGPQLGGFPEYMVRFEAGNPNALGIRGELMQNVDGSIIVPLVLGRPGWRGNLLRFPLRVGAKWTDRFQRQPRGTAVQWADGEYEVQSWEKIKTQKGELDAFRIVLNSSAVGGPKGKGRALPLTCTYYYSPAVKAIVALSEVLPDAGVTSTLVDFKLFD